MMLNPGRANFIIDGQWGSTGKGKLAGYIAKRSDIALATADFQPNAGHTFEDTDVKYVTNYLPLSFVNMDCRLALTPASTIHIPSLLRELEEFSHLGVANRLSIHPHAGIVDPKDTETERQHLKGIASTQKGSGAALARKTMRNAGLAKDYPELERYLSDTTELVHTTLRGNGTVLCETAQGFDLSLNHGHKYPFTTSRDVTTMSAANNAGVPPQLIGRVWGSLRTFPIRVGNLVDGERSYSSGPHYHDHRELTWQELRDTSGNSDMDPETTTVTKRVRRIFTFSFKQFNRFVRVCGPTDLFVNFVNYINHEDYRCRTKDLLSFDTKKFVSLLNQEIYDQHNVFHTRVSLLGTGPSDKDMVEW